MNYPSPISKNIFFVGILKGSLFSGTEWLYLAHKDTVHTFLYKSTLVSNPIDNPNLECPHLIGDLKVNEIDPSAVCYLVIYYL